MIRVRKEGRDQRGGAARVVRYMAGIGTGVRYGVHTSTLQNLARGIVERVFRVSDGNGGLKLPPRPKRGVFARLGSIRTRLLKKLSPTPIVAGSDYHLLHVGRKQRLYERAWESLVVKAVNSRDAIVSTFVKAEKVNLDAKGDPAPRVIQPRSPRYNLVVGCYLKLFEKELFKGFERVWGYKVVLKGLNALGVAAALREHWERFRDPVAVGLDASRFDQHVSVDALKWEHSIYNAVFRCPRLRWLLKMQLRNRGIARVEDYRVDYTVEGCRMSGDLNTGMGNCLIMSSMVLAYLEQHGIDARLANNGDDCVLILERSDLDRLDGISAWMLDFGFTLTREEPVDVFERIEFCQTQPVLTADGWIMCRNPWVAMSKDATSLLSWDKEADIRAWARAIGECGLSLTRSVPVWSAWYQRLVVAAGEARTRGVESVRDSGLGYMACNVSASGMITPEARVSFWRAFGISPDQQEDCESAYSEPWHWASPAPMIFDSAKVIDRDNPLSVIQHG